MPRSQGPLLQGLERSHTNLEVESQRFPAILCHLLAGHSVLMQCSADAASNAAGQTAVPLKNTNFLHQGLQDTPLLRNQSGAGRWALRPAIVL